MLGFASFRPLLGMQITHDARREVNKTIRSYHGHLSGIYSVDLHPTLDVLVSAGRDASARVR